MFVTENRRSTVDDVVWRKVFFVNVFFSCVSFSIVLPSIWPYLSILQSSESVLAFAVAIYSVGEAVGSLAFGAWSNKQSFKVVVTTCTVVGVVGSFLYSTAVSGGAFFGPPMILVGRFLQGLWTGGAQASQMNYLARVLKDGDLTSMTVKMNGWACLGFVVGPAFGVMFAGQTFSLGMFLFNEITLPGYLCALLGVMIIAAFTLFFNEDTEGLRKEGTDVAAPESDETQPLLKAPFTAPPLGIGLIMCNLVFAVHFFGFALQETITTPVVQQFYGWNVFQANALFTGAGILSLLTFVALNYLGDTVSDRMLVFISLVIGVIGYGLLMDLPSGVFPLWRFVLGFGIVSVAFPIGRAIVVAMYSKVIGPNDQGVWMGILFAVGALARILGPFLAVKGLEFGGAALVFGGTSFIFAISVVLMLVAYKTMAPFAELHKTSELQV
uniref:Major facilitator superfamily (MFS) profile domain-containing protein n=1 Tax=Rhodosorus marinus TaxID=101924 RepID=A0A7S0BG08_9RHOD|mmetsp:Transcript_13668/g.19717  ORF Transcript_13668/g.19717 Transcript_13668/m.19717 type:complete len:440 (+) Transcript_13668:207-1526(+)